MVSVLLNLHGTTSGNSLLQQKYQEYGFPRKRENLFEKRKMLSEREKC